MREPLTFYFEIQMTRGSTVQVNTRLETEVAGNQFNLNEEKRETKYRHNMSAHMNQLEAALKSVPHNGRVRVRENQIFQSHFLIIWAVTTVAGDTLCARSLCVVHAY